MREQTDPARVRQFFGSRAATWDERFPDDEPRYRRAIAELAPPPGGAVLDDGCGTGRALPILREAVGADGVVVGIDLVPQMLAEARRRHRDRTARLLLADAGHVPIGTATVDAVFAAGLLSHLPDQRQALRELARVTAPAGRLALFHPVGRRDLAARHGRALEPDDPRSEPRVRAALVATGWRCLSVDDAADRYLVTALRGG